ncbi:helix-turn-helix transcriptional regulator [Nocardia pseudovaccinii]|uniref:helix-turn-helix transcriptional regulator n=1 Tax=Nocardia pseudovaccinii TaxID=189540 RepID=UPI003D91B87E
MSERRDLQLCEKHDSSPRKVITRSNCTLSTATNSESLLRRYGSAGRDEHAVYRVWGDALSNKNFRHTTEPPMVGAGFLGRDTELNTVLLLLMKTRQLITLCGPGGIGKTQLAAAAIRRYRKASGVPVRWVWLASLPKEANSAALEEEIAGVVAGGSPFGRSAWDVIVDALTHTPPTAGRSQALLVLDNCEHVHAGIALVVARMLAELPRLTVLATSRQSLGIVGEQVVPVMPLRRRDSLALFRHRAEIVGQPLADDQVETATEVCRHLHDNPLYIRLAAARLVRRPIRVILDELNGEIEIDRRLRWPSTPVVGAEKRHRGIGDAIAWSYDLCSDDERLLFERMAVFAAGSDVHPEDASADVGVGVGLAAIEAVCSDMPDPRSESATAGRLSRNDIGRLLARLVDRSLVSVHLSHQEPRYALSECSQVFASERLRDRPSRAVGDPVRRHLHYYRDRLTDFAIDWFGPREEELRDWLRSNRSNVLLAIRASFQSPAKAAAGLEICVALLTLPTASKPSLRQTRHWTEHALTGTRLVAAAAPTKLQLRAATLLAWHAFQEGMHDEAQRLLDHCVSSCDIASSDHLRWRDTAAVDIGLPAAVELAWGYELWMVHHDVDAVAVLTRARDKFERDGQPGFAARCDLSATLAAIHLDTAEQGRRSIQQFHARATMKNSHWAMAWAGLLEAVYLIEDNPDRVLNIINWSAPYLIAMDDQWSAPWAIMLRACVLAREFTNRSDTDPRRITDAAEVARLTGALDSLRTCFGAGVYPLVKFARCAEAALSLARELLGHEAFMSARDSGARLVLDQRGLVRVVVDPLDGNSQEQTHPSCTSSNSQWLELTSAEQHIAVLAAAGWTNKAIAARRGTSIGTVRGQMAAVRTKLMVSSRREIVHFVPDAERSVVQREARSRLAGSRRPADPRWSVGYMPLPGTRTRT